MIGRNPATTRVTTDHAMALQRIGTWNNECCFSALSASSTELSTNLRSIGNCYVTLRDACKGNQTRDTPKNTHRKTGFAHAGSKIPILSNITQWHSCSCVMWAANLIALCITSSISRTSAFIAAVHRISSPIRLPISLRLILALEKSRCD